MTPAESIILDAVRAGVLLYADGKYLRYKALRQMPPDLARRIREHRDDLLELLEPSAKGDAKSDGQPVTTVTNTKTPAVNSANGGIGDGDGGDASTPSDPAGSGADPRPDGLRPGAIVASVVDVFGGPESVRVVKDTDARAHCRRQVKASLLPIQQSDPAACDAMIDHWKERVAICEAEPDMTTEAAERIARDDVLAAAERHRNLTGKDVSK